MWNPVKLENSEAQECVHVWNDWDEATKTTKQQQQKQYIHTYDEQGKEIAK